MNIRPARKEDCQGIARVQVDSYHSAYSGILPAEYLEAFSYQDQENDWLDWFASPEQELLYVADTGKGEVIGYGLARENPADLSPYQGELVALHVRREYQGQGLGCCLFSTVAAGLSGLGCRSLFLWVLESNPARSFYEKLGGQLVGIKPWQNNEHFGTAIREFAFGWLEIHDLFNPD
jgi:ribosomal protein S18 acetylase RimI-like enzyme